MTMSIIPWPCLIDYPNQADPNKTTSNSDLVNPNPKITSKVNVPDKTSVIQTKIP